jgi:hypothetical protein
VVCIALVVRSFVYTGPLIQLRDTLVHAARIYDTRIGPLVGKEIADIDVRERRDLSHTLAEERRKLEEALQHPLRPSPFWLPSNESQWAHWADRSRSLAAEFGRLQRELRPQEPRGT